MYIDDVKVKPEVVVPLKHGNRICFGVNIDRNDLKYELTCKEANSTLTLVRRIKGTDSKGETVQQSTSPLLGNGKRGLSEDGGTTSKEVPIPKKKPRLSAEDKESLTIEKQVKANPKKKPRLSTAEDKESLTTEIQLKAIPKKKPRLSAAEDKESLTAEKQVKANPKKKLRLSAEDKESLTAEKQLKTRRSTEVECVAVEEKDYASIKSTSKSKTSTLKVATSSVNVDPKCSPVLTVLSSTPKPSPALSVASTRSVTSEIDELFDVEPESTTIVEESIFGGIGRSSSASSKVFEERRGLDATMLQIQLAKEKNDQEKNKLLSSIEALKSELAAKNQLLAEKEEKTKAAVDVGNSVVSSMQEEFTCVICQELFINAYTLPCAHSFCEWCIKEWMKRKGHKDCPICRKKITSEPVHSLALDNAVSKLVEKLSPDEQKERKDTESQHKEALSSLNPPRGERRKAATTSVGTAGRITTRSSGRVLDLRASGTSSSTVVINLSGTGPTITRTTGGPIVLDSSTESDSNSYSDSQDSDDSDSSDPALSGEYYGGYGRCFNCGKLITCTCVCV